MAFSILRLSNNTPISAGSFTFTPVADSYVDSSNRDINKGKSTQIRVDGSPEVNSYLKFDVRNLAGSVNSATLRVWANSNQSKGISLRSVNDNTWVETTITYANAPFPSSTVTSLTGPIVAGNWYSFNVTPLISGDGMVSFALTSTSVTALSLASRETNINSPQLIIETSAAVPSPSPSESPISSPTPSSSGSPFPTPSPIPPLSPDDSAVIAAAGDISCSAGSSGAACKQMETSNLLVNINPAAVLLLGDNQYEQGAYNDFVNFYHPSWGRLKSVTYPSVGNHEYLTTDASGYFDYFNGVGNQAGQAGERSKGYYSYNIGSWHLIALNSNCSKAGGCGVGSAQETWLRADLSANTTSCVLAYFHHPLYSSGGRASTGVRPLYQTLYNYNADLILTGHDHTYERFAPQDANGNADWIRGIRQFVVGTGGRNHTHLASSFANSEVFDDTSFGVIKLTLNPTNYSWQFVSIPGNNFTDSGTTFCH